MKSVSKLPLSENYTVDQALDVAKTEGLSEVLVLGEYANGSVFACSSKMSRQTALFILEREKLRVMGIVE